jgi:hypothetical protein
VCQNLEGKRIWVRFKIEYDGGRFVGRNAKTQLPSRFAGPDGLVGPSEVSLIWTDNRAAIRTANVHVRYLEPAPPTSKGKQGVVLTGLHRGGIIQVIQYRKKDGIVKVSDNSSTWEEPQNNVCLIE